MANLEADQTKDRFESREFSIWDYIKYVPLAFLTYPLFLFVNLSFVTIPPDSHGVKFKRADGAIEKEKIYNEGFHFVMPWDNMIVYDVRLNESVGTMDVLSKNGQSIAVELSYRFMPIPDKIGYLHDEVGHAYAERVIRPEMRSATKEVIARYLAQDLVVIEWEAIQDEIFQKVQKAMTSRYIHLEDVKIGSVEASS